MAMSGRNFLDPAIGHPALRWWRRLALLMMAAVAVLIGSHLLPRGERPRTDTTNRGDSETLTPSKQAHESAWVSAVAAKGAAVALFVIDRNGEVIHETANARTAFSPASSLKVLTTAAALETLGPDFRFETRLAGDFDADSGRVLGDLSVIGGGDPTTDDRSIENLVEQLVARGIRHVDGRLVRSPMESFPDTPVSPFWDWGDIGNGYGAGAWDLNFRRNRIQVSFDGGEKLDDFARMTPPQMPFAIEWENHVISGPLASGDQVSAFSSPGGNRIVLRGRVPMRAAGFRVSVACPFPPGQFLAALQEALRNAGISVREKTELPQPRKLEILAVHHSAPLPRIVRHIHEVSDNLESQCLLFAMATRSAAEDEPPKELENFWRQKGIEFRALRLLDGSGLARAARIRPCDLAKVFQAALDGPHGEQFRESLNRTTLHDGSIIHSKLGAMSGVRTEVGLITLPDAQQAIFVWMVNGLPPGEPVPKPDQEITDLVRGHLNR